MKIKYNQPFTMIENKTIRNKTLTIYQKMVYIVLCSYANDKNVCFPSYQTIADGVGCSKRMVIKTMNDLVEMGVIVKHPRKSANGDATANEYEILLYDEYCALPNEQCAPPGRESPAPPDECHAPEPYSNNNTYSLNDIHPSITEATELEEILEQCEIEGLNNEKIEKLFCQTITDMYNAEKINVRGNTYPQKEVRANMRRLDYEIIVHAYNALTSSTIVTTPKKYLTSVLYNGIFEVGVGE